MGQRVRGFDMTRRAADHHRQLTLEIQLHGGSRPYQGAAMADQRIGKTREDHGMLRHLPPGFLDMREIVDADAKNLVGIWNDG
jgi:hypothetical protein